MAPCIQIGKLKGRHISHIGFRSMRNLIEQKSGFHGLSILEKLTKMAVKWLSLIKVEMTFGARSLLFGPQKNLF